MAYSLDSLGPIVRDRLLLGWLAGAGFWLSWMISLALGGWTTDATGHPLGADHVQYYAVGLLVNENRAAEIYDLETMKTLQAEIGGPGWKGVLPFRYPPFYAVAFSLTSRLPYPVSYVLWAILSLLVLIGAGCLLEGTFPLVWLRWALCFYPVFAASSFGQNSLLSLGLLTLTWALLRKQHGFVAGLVAGLLLYKPQLLVGVVLLLLLEARKRWPALLGMTVTGVGLVGFAWAVVPDACQRFVGASRDLVTMQDRLALAQLYSTQGFWMLLLPGFNQLAQLLSVGCSVLAVVGFIMLWRRNPDEDTRFAYAIAMTLLISPYAMIYDWSILLLPAALLWRRWPELSERWYVVFALIWVAAFVSAPLVRGQLQLSEIALQLSVPALIVAVWQSSLPASACGKTVGAEPRP